MPSSISSAGGDARLITEENEDNDSLFSAPEHFVVDVRITNSLISYSQKKWIHSIHAKARS